MKKIGKFLEQYMIVIFTIGMYFLTGWFTNKILITDNNSNLIGMLSVAILSVGSLFFTKNWDNPTLPRWINRIFVLCVVLLTVYFYVDLDSKPYVYQKANIEIESITETSTKYIVDLVNSTYTLYFNKVDSVDYDTVCYDGYETYYGVVEDLVGDTLRTQLMLGNGTEFKTLRTIRK